MRADTIARVHRFSSDYPLDHSAANGKSEE
jgi:hypothetical protein